MNDACIPHSQLPGSTALFLDFLYRFERLEDFYPFPPGPAAALEAARLVDYPPDRRRSICDLLRRQNANVGPAVDEALDRLSRPDTVAVATGQQVGLLGGPAFSVYKALSALRYAEELERRGRPAVAVFWLATEDHDRAEVDHAWIFDRERRPRRLESDASRPAATPVGPQPASAPIAELSSAWSGFAFGGEAVEMAARAYAPGATYGAAFAKLLRELFEGRPLLLLDPLDPSARELAQPLLRKVIEQMPGLLEDVRARGRALGEAGYHEQVQVGDDAALMFLLRGDKRTPVRRKGQEYLAAGERYSTSSLLDLLDGQPSAFSPNALLRPVVQDYLLPTAVLVGGPAEIAYLAQSRPLYERLLGRMPLIAARASFTLLSPRTAKLLERHKLSFQDCLAPYDALRQKIAERLIPPQLETAFEERKAEVSAALNSLGGSLESFDPTLAQAFSRSRRKIDYQLGRMQGKAAREAMRRDERAGREADELHHTLFPRRTLQERLYSFLPFYAEAGPRLIDRLHRAAEPSCLDHRLLAY